MSNRNISADKDGRLVLIIGKHVDDIKLCGEAAVAKWFVEQGDFVRAFGAINYAHAWIDCAVKIGLMDGHDDDEMFTLP